MIHYYPNILHFTDFNGSVLVNCFNKLFNIFFIMCVLSPFKIKECWASPFLSVFLLGTLTLSINTALINILIFITDIFILGWVSSKISHISWSVICVLNNLCIIIPHCLIDRFWSKMMWYGNALQNCSALIRNSEGNDGLNSDSDFVSSCLVRTTRNVTCSWVLPPEIISWDFSTTLMSASWLYRSLATARTSPKIIKMKSEWDVKYAINSDYALSMKLCSWWTKMMKLQKQERLKKPKNIRRVCWPGMKL